MGEGERAENGDRGLSVEDEKDDEGFSIIRKGSVRPKDKVKHAAL